MSSLDELARATAVQARKRQDRIAAKREQDKQTVALTLTRGQIEAVCIGLMMLGAHEPDGSYPDMESAYGALAGKIGWRRR